MVIKNFGSNNKIDLSDKERELFAALSSGKSENSVIASTGVSVSELESIIVSCRFILAANDSDIDEFLHLVENWPSNDNEEFFFPHDRAKEDPSSYMVKPSQSDTENTGGRMRRKTDIIEKIESEWSPFEMRDLGASLIRLADAMDQNWDPANVRSLFHWPSAAARIERNSIELAKQAVLLKCQNGVKKKVLPEAMLGEPTWNMLLELFCQFAGGAKISTKSLCIAADCPETTALRYIDRLEECDLVIRSRTETDRRVTMVGLTRKGVVGVGRILERIAT